MTEPTKGEPTEGDPGGADPGRDDPSRADPSENDPGRDHPSRADRSPADRDRAAVTAANTAYYAAFENADIDAMDALWLDGEAGRDVLCVHPGWSPLRGRARVMRSWSVIMANTPYIQFVITDVEVDVAGNTAIVSCSENVLTGSRDPTDSTLGFTSGLVVATNVFRRTSGGWRLWAHHSSPVIPTEDDDIAEGERDDSGVIDDGSSGG